MAPIDRFLLKTKGLKPYSYYECCALAALVDAGAMSDSKFKECLVDHSIHGALHMALKSPLVDSNDEKEDILTITYIYLLQRAATYDVSRQCSFHTYACRWLANALKDYVSSQNPVATIPRWSLHRYDDAGNIGDSVRAILSTPTSATLPAELSELPSEVESSAHEHLDATELKVVIGEALAHVCKNKRYAAIYTAVFGLKDTHPRAVTEIAKEYGYTARHIYTIVNDINDAIRSSKYALKLKSYLN